MWFPCTAVRMREGTPMKLCEDFFNVFFKEQNLKELQAIRHVGSECRIFLFRVAGVCV